MFARNEKLIRAIALRLQRVRKHTGLSPKEMAAHMGITHGAYIKNERGMNFPGMVTLQRLAKDFDISMDWFLFNKEPMHYKEKSKREKELEQAFEQSKQTAAALKSELDEMKSRGDKTKNEADELKKQLAEEREKQEKAAEEREKDFGMRPEVRELLDYMEQDQVFYHKLMLNFQEFKNQKKEIGTVDMSDTSPPQLLEQS